MVLSELAPAFLRMSCSGWPLQANAHQDPSHVPPAQSIAGPAHRMCILCSRPTQMFTLPKVLPTLAPSPSWWPTPCGSGLGGTVLLMPSPQRHILPAGPALHLHTCAMPSPGSYIDSKATVSPGSLCTSHTEGPPFTQAVPGLCMLGLDHSQSLASGPGHTYPGASKTQPTSYSITHTHHWHSPWCPGCGTKSSDTQYPTSGLCLPDATQSGQSGHWAAPEHSNMVNTVATPLPSLCPTSLLCPCHPTQGTAGHRSSQASPHQCPHTLGLTTASLLFCPLFVPVARHELSTDTY